MIPFKGIRPINVLQLEEILDRVYFGSVVVDDTGIITFLSQPYADFLGIRREEAIGRHVTDVIENTRMHIVVKTGEVEIGKQRIRGQDLVVQRVPIRDESGRIVGAFGQVMFEVQELQDLVSRLKILESKVAYYERELDSLRASRYTIDHIIGTSAPMKEAKRLALKAARSMSAVLLLGETGAGKELFAHAIHHASPRRFRPFVRVNCAAMPRDLVESELFGYEPGAFTGASRRGKPGKFELAHGGSLFLDEIGDMALDMQAKLLRVLQEKEVERVGSTRPLAVDFRLIAATHENLEELVRRERFRTDLYYRLNVFPIRIPPLRERREDIPALVAHFLRRLREEMGRFEVKVTPGAMTALRDHHWPGNVRELINVLERILNALDGDRIEVAHLPFGSPDRPSALRAAEAGQLRRLLRDQEHLALQEALKLANGNKSRAARLLGIHRTSLYKKLGRRL
ncbi:MAG: sigma 54-interacting transcriptional regulator [Candidatus Rokubacteria bacterium]|nr:sigma 54-interacting transcriptional regulator [Candidatus Rokubacteria bacterium]